MIDKAFWEKVADEWKKSDDGIVIPDIDTSGAEGIEDEGILFDQISDAEIDDILSDLGLDDI